MSGPADQDEPGKPSDDPRLFSLMIYAFLLRRLGVKDPVIFSPYS